VKGEKRKMLNRTTKFLVVFCLLSVVLSTGAWADDNHMLPMLRMGVGARALSMGSAYVAEASDATAGYWNPAGLVDIEKASLTAMYSAGMSFDRSYNYFAFGYTFDFGTLGISWLNSGITDIPGYDVNDNPTGTFKDMNNAFLISYAYKYPNKSLSVGGSFKVVNQKIDDYSKTGVGGDIGLKFHPTDNSAAGIIVRDIGTQVDGWTVPTSIQVGVVLYPLEGFTFPVDVTKTIHRSDLNYHMGGEYSYEFCDSYWAKIRAGVNDGRFTIGTGFQFSKVMIDYGYVVEKEQFMNENHKISLSVEF
jgi:hypothetical protein